MSVLRDRIIDDHIAKHYPNAKVVRYDSPESRLEFYTAGQLQELEKDWFPLCCYIDPNTGEAVYGGRNKIVHTYTEGETGAGKTTRFVMQSIRALSSMKKKPSFVLVDIHGEIIENLYTHLKENGYRIQILNCDRPQRSDSYNPFADIAHDCLAEGELSADSMNRIRRISEIIQPVESRDDPIWDRGARSYTNGCIIDKFEDLMRGDIPPECLTLYNIIQNHYWLRDQLSASYDNDLFRIEHYKRKGSKALSVQKLISVTNNAEKTRASYWGVVENHYDVFGQPSMYYLSSGNTIDIEKFIEEPTVIVIQSGNTKAGDDLISLLVNDIYTHVVKVGKASSRKMLSRKIHCFLDEFANCNIAEGPEYIKMLTTSRKFGMYWHMILQCDAQLDRKFDPNIGRIIRANSTEIFMGSHDYETEVRFAKSCGQKTIEALGSRLSQQMPALDTVDLVTAEDLNLMPEGWMYIKTNRHPLLLSYFEAYYNCAHFSPAPDIDSIYPHNTLKYQDTAFFPDDIPAHISPEACEILEFLNTGPMTLTDVHDLYSGAVSAALEELTDKEMIEICPEQIRVLVTQAQLSLLKYRRQHQIGQPEQVPVSKPRPNPFDALFEGMDTEEEEAESEEEEDDIWTPDPWSFAGPTRSKIYEDFKAFVQIHKDRLQLIDLSELTCIPESLQQTWNTLVLGQPEKEQSAFLPSHINILKFEIIENYIAAHKFAEKESWDMGIREEVRVILELEPFTPEIQQVFQNARDELVNDLTLENILEIRKIITDNTDEE